MAKILIKPTDTTSATYEADLAVYRSRQQSIRRIASPDIAEPLTTEQLPDDLLEDEYYINSAEDKVLRDTGFTTISPDDNNFPKVLRLVQRRMAIMLIPQAAQIIRTSFLQDQVQYQEIDWQKRIEELEEEYLADVQELNPDSSTAFAGNLVNIVTTTTAEDYD